MNIRQLTQSDVEAYWAIRLRSLKEHPDAFGSTYEDAAGRPIEQVAERMAVADDQFILGAFEDDTLIGIVGFMRETNPKLKHKGMIWGMYSAAEHRGKGVGRALMQAVIERSRSLPGLEQINLVVVTTNPAAKNLYESLGFESFGVEKRAMFVNGEYLDEAYMTLFLN